MNARDNVEECVVVVHRELYNASRRLKNKLKGGPNTEEFSNERNHIDEFQVQLMGGGYIHFSKSRVLHQKIFIICKVCYDINYFTYYKFSSHLYFN